MSDKPSSHQGISEQIRTGVKGIHGAGEALRGTVMKVADDVFDTKQDNAKNQALINKGLTDMKRADNMVGHQHGVPGATGGADAAVEARRAEGMQNAGAHSTAPGNVGGMHATGPTQANVNVPQEHAGTTQRF